MQIRPPRSALLSAIIPDGRVLPAVVLIAGACLWACSRDARATRLPTERADEQVFRISCGNGIEVCREKALEVCSGAYQVLETAGAAIEPPRVTTAPGPRTTGPRYTRLKWLGHMVVACGDAPLTVSSSASPASSGRGSRAPGVSDSARLCVPGATQECLGPGACRGAQPCMADGQGYDRCDCGAQTPSDASGLPHTQSPDAGASGP